MTPRDRKRAENGELDHVLQESDQELPEGYISGGVFNEPEQGVFIPEHEAEATALKIAGHVVVPKEQEMELLSSSAKHDREYQEAVKEHGFDRRPVVEMLQQDVPRVPDEMLHGGETRTGLPHYRGPEGGQEDALAENKQATEESSEDSEKDSASRPAPGSQSQSETSEQAQAQPQQAQPQTTGQQQSSTPPQQGQK
jgi:hypothetical protein